MSDFDHVYRWRSAKTWGGPGDNPLYGVRCRILVTGPGKGPHNHLIETEDGRRIVVPFRAVGRPRKKKQSPQLSLGL